MKNLIEFQLQEFRRNFTISRALIIISLITFAFMIHFLSTRGNNEFWIAISMRLYYSPIIYTAIFAGFYISILVSIIVALAHLFTMLSLEHHVHTIMLEHLVETPFLVLLGVSAGFLRDFLLFEKNKKNEIVELFGKVCFAAGCR